MSDIRNIKIIAFDADDTLWANEPFFKETERAFGEMMHEYLPHEEALQTLFATEFQNTPDYGVGIKSMILFMIEASIALSDKRVTAASIEKIIHIGREMLHKPVELLEGVEDVLKTLQGSYRLVVATKEICLTSNGS